MNNKNICITENQTLDSRFKNHSTINATQICVISWISSWVLVQPEKKDHFRYDSIQKWEKVCLFQKHRSSWGNRISDKLNFLISFDVELQAFLILLNICLKWTVRTFNFYLCLSNSFKDFFINKTRISSESSM